MTYAPLPIVIAVILLMGTLSTEKKIEEVNGTYWVKPTRLDSLNALMLAMTHVESRGDSLAYNKREQAAGVLQIRPIMLREINQQLRRAGRTYQYTREERFSKAMSERMFLDYVRLLHPNDSLECIARCWNGGPKGMKKKSTIQYWSKVKELLTNVSKSK